MVLLLQYTALSGCILYCSIIMVSTTAAVAADAAAAGDVEAATAAGTVVAQIGHHLPS